MKETKGFKFQLLPKWTVGGWEGGHAFLYCSIKTAFFLTFYELFILKAEKLSYLLTLGKEWNLISASVVLTVVLINEAEGGYRAFRVDTLQICIYGHQFVD